MKAIFPLANAVPLFVGQFARQMKGGQGGLAQAVTEVTVISQSQSKQCRMDGSNIRIFSHHKVGMYTETASSSLPLNSKLNASCLKPCVPARRPLKLPSSNWESTALLSILGIRPRPRANPKLLGPRIHQRTASRRAVRIRKTLPGDELLAAPVAHVLCAIHIRHQPARLDGASTTLSRRVIGDRNDVNGPIAGRLIVVSSGGTIEPAALFAILERRPGTRADAKRRLGSRVDGRAAVGRAVRVGEAAARDELGAAAVADVARAVGVGFERAGLDAGGGASCAGAASGGRGCVTIAVAIHARGSGSTTTTAEPASLFAGLELGTDAGADTDGLAAAGQGRAAARRAVGGAEALAADELDAAAVSNVLGAGGIGEALAGEDGRGGVDGGGGEEEGERRRQG